MRGIILAVGMAGLCGVVGGCRSGEPEEPWAPTKPDVDYNRPLPPGKLALRKISPENYPDFRRAFGDRDGLKEAIDHSLDYLSRPSSRRYFPYGVITHEQAQASLEEFLRVLDEAHNRDQFDELIRRRFDVYQSVGYDGRGAVHFTGYYTPIFDGRKQPDGRFRYPLYGLPPDLVKDAEGRTLGRRTADGQIVRYWTREEIETRRPLAGQEIAWLADPFETYIVTVQGSVRLRLEDGSLWELGYAGNTGHDYVSIGRLMVQDGVIDGNDLSLPTMMAYFDKHPDAVAHYCRQNPRYVFFKESSGGPFGSINVPVTADRTIATDKEVFPRACLAFLDCGLPALVDGRMSNREQARFVLDQDTGGAIRAAGRSDVYFGVGPTAEILAGRANSDGALYYLFVKP